MTKVARAIRAINDQTTQNRGVRSDVVLPSRIDHMDLGESFLDNALAFDRINPARGVYNTGLSSAEFAQQLQQASQNRVSQNAEFQKLNKQIARLVERKNRDTISLQESVLAAQRELEEQESDELFPTIEGDAESGDKKDKEVFPQTFYNDEILEIAADYYSLLKQAKVVQGGRVAP